MIPYGRQAINQADIDAVIAVLKSDFITQGPRVPKFEQALAEYTGAQYAVALNSATSALHVACLALGLEPGDSVWTSPNTFVASANCALYCGASVDFVDIELDYYNMSVEALEYKLSVAEKTGKLPKIVIPVHFAGQSCAMQAIKKLAEQYGFFIIEDASHALGGYYQGKQIGCCEYADITVFSFHPVKMITTGEGGAALTNNSELFAQMELLRSHGVTRDPELLKQNHGAWYYEQQALGYNYRMTDLQAALGCSQLTRLNEFVEKRHEVFCNYEKLLQHLPVRLPKQNLKSKSSLHLYPILLEDGQLREPLFNYLRKNNIGVNVHYIPVYKQPYYQQLGFANNYCVNAEEYYARAISLPMFPGLELKQQQHIAQIMELYYEASIRNSAVRA